MLMCSMEYVLVYSQECTANRIAVVLFGLITGSVIEYVVLLYNYSVVTDQCGLLWLKCYTNNITAISIVLYTQTDRQVLHYITCITLQCTSQEYACLPLSPAMAVILMASM